VDWETQVKRQSHFEKFYYGSTQTRAGSKHRKLLRKMVAASKLDTPVYARLLMNVPQTHSRDPRQVARVASLKRCLNRLGVPPHRVAVSYVAPHHSAAMARKNKNMIIVVIDQYDVTLPTCPGWGEMGFQTLPQGEKQFGCVTERNFARMIQEPRDLYESASLSNRDGPYNAAAVTRLRENKLNIADASETTTNIE